MVRVVTDYLLIKIIVANLKSLAEEILCVVERFFL